MRKRELLRGLAALVTATLIGGSALAQGMGGGRRRREEEERMTGKKQKPRPKVICETGGSGQRICRTRRNRGRGR